VLIPELFKEFGDAGASGELLICAISSVLQDFAYRCANRIATAPRRSNPKEKIPGPPPETLPEFDLIGLGLLSFLAYTSESLLPLSGKTRNQPPAHDSKSEPKGSSRQPIIYRCCVSHLNDVLLSPFSVRFLGSAALRLKFLCKLFAR
jgi:hypothetical protein